MKMEKISKKVIDCCKSVYELYETEDGGCGGYGHIVFDDGNLELDSIDFCIQKIYQNPFVYCQNTLNKSLEALIKIKELSLIERYFVYHCWSAYKEYEE